MPASISMNREARSEADKKLEIFKEYDGVFAIFVIVVEWEPRYVAVFR